MDIIGLDIPATYFARHGGSAGISAAQSSFNGWHQITVDSRWDNPQQVQSAHSRASILKAGRVVFNIKGNDFRLICRIDYVDHIVAIRWFGSHREYDMIDAETI